MRAFLLLLLTIAGSGLASAQNLPTFYARTDLTSYISCQAAIGIIQVADFNRDGIPDLLCSTMQLGNGDGTFRPGPIFNTSGAVLSPAYAVDVNGDGTPDVVYAELQNGRLGLAVMLGNGDATSGKLLATFIHVSELNGIAYSPDGLYLATAGDDDTARVWDAATGQQVSQVRHTGVVHWVTFTPDGKFLGHRFRQPHRPPLALATR